MATSLVGASSAFTNSRIVPLGNSRTRTVVNRFIVFSVLLLTLPVLVFFYVKNGGGRSLLGLVGLKNSLQTCAFLAIVTAQAIVILYVVFAFREENVETPKRDN
eukprot:jgi/Galph1/891/GphlegSOOS_G5657.1